MNVTAILTQLRTERDRLDAAIAALEQVSPTGTRFKQTRRTRKGRKPHRMSATARKRMSEARRKWWAERKASK